MKNGKRYLSIALSLALFLALPLAFTQEAAAASGTKIQQPVMVTMVTTGEEGDWSVTNTFTYDKKGLNVESVSNYNDGGKETWIMTYDKKGNMISEKGLGYTGNPFSEYTYKYNKKGRVTLENEFNIENGVSTPDGTTSYVYKKGKLKTKTYTSADGKYAYVSTYRKSGYKSKQVNTEPYEKYETVFDKKGNKVSTVSSWTDPDIGQTYTYSSAYKNTYKKGKLIKTQETITSVDGTVSEGETTTYSYDKKGRLKTSVNTYKYGGYEDTPATTAVYTETYTYSKGGLIKRIDSTTVETTASGTKTTRTSTRTYQYKKIKVSKKCVNAVKERMKSYNYKSFLPGDFDF